MKNRKLQGKQAIDLSIYWLILNSKYQFKKSSFYPAHCVPIKKYVSDLCTKYSLLYLLYLRPNGSRQGQQSAFLRGGQDEWEAVMILHM